MLPVPPSQGDVAGGEGGSAANTTLELLVRARNGDHRALDEVFSREIPRLTRWARGRLPQWARGGLDTDDLVQDTVVQTLKRIDVFEYRADSALQAYLRQAIMNRIRNEIRRSRRHPAAKAIDSQVEGSELSPLQELIGKEALDAYDAALEKMTPSEREAIIGRIELDLSYKELAEALGRPSPDAARMAVGRALVKLAQLMDQDGHPSP